MNATLPSAGSRRGVAAAGAVIAVLAAPLVLSEYLTGVVLDAMILGLLAMSFNLLFGYTGLLSFGHAAFYGSGAYLVAIVLSSGRFPEAMESMLPAMVVAVVGTALVAAAIGILCVQRGDIYFAMLTLAFSMMLYRLAIQWDDLTGGVNGTIISGAEFDFLVFSFSALDTDMYYYFTFLVVFVSLVLLWRLVNSPYGELLKVIRENPQRAEFVGLPVKRYQLSAFVISGTFGGLAGSLAAARIFVVSPETLHWLKSAEPVIITLIGGPWSFAGPLLGTVVFVGLEEVLTSLTQYWHVALGVILIPLVLFAQNGLVGLFSGDDGPLAAVRSRLEGGTEPTEVDSTEVEP